jgi:hypothetical protein
MVTDLQKFPARSRTLKKIKIHLACLAPLGTVQFCAGLCTNTGKITLANFFVGGVYHPPPMIFFVMSFHYFVKTVFRKEYSVTNSPPFFFWKIPKKMELFFVPKLTTIAYNSERVLENFFFHILITVKFE